MRKLFTSNPFLLLVLLAPLCTVAQTKIIFDGNGVIRYKNQTNTEVYAQKVDYVVFKIVEPVANYKYFISYEFLEEPVYSNTQLDGIQVFHFGNTDSIEIPFPKGKNKKSFLRYQLFRVSKDIYGKELENKKKLIDLSEGFKDAVKKNSKERSEAFLKKLRKVRFDSIQSAFTNLNSLIDYTAKKTKLERSLVEVMALKDSLTLEDQFKYNELKETNRIIKQRIQQYATLLESTLKGKADVSAQLLTDLGRAHSDYVVNMDAITVLEIKKKNYKLEKLDELKQEIQTVDHGIADILGGPYASISLSLSNAITAITYKREFLYGGVVFADNKIKWALYDAAASGNALTGFNRISGPLPVLDELEYLGVSLLNVPLQSINKQTEFKVEFITEKSTEVIDRFGGVRTVLSTDQIGEILKDTYGSVSIDKGIFSIKSLENFGTLPKCNEVVTRPYEEIFSQEAEVIASCRALESDIRDARKKYDEFVKKITDLIKGKIDASYDKTLVDYNLVYGSRFVQKDVPVIKISGKAPSKDTPAPVYVNDKLEQVVKRYWFAVSTGLTYSAVLNYNYVVKTDPQTQTQQLTQVAYQDRKVAPALFLSGYIWGQRIDQKIKFREVYKTLSLNVGADLNKPLENVYPGIGFEPIRHLQITFGYKFSKVQKLDTDTYDPYQLNYKPYLKDQWNRSPFISVNLYLNVFQTIIKTIFTKK